MSTSIVHTPQASVRLHCDTDGCENVLQVPREQNIRQALDSSGWTRHNSIAGTADACTVHRYGASDSTRDAGA